MPCNRALVGRLRLEHELARPLNQTSMRPGALVALVVPFCAELVVLLVCRGLGVVPGPITYKKVVPALIPLQETPPVGARLLERREMFQPELALGAAEAPEDVQRL